jgi:signal transduction histidine kinase
MTKAGGVRPIGVYVAAVTALAAAAVLLDRPDVAAFLPQRVVMLFLACVASELLWLPTLSDQATASSASMVNFAVLFLLPPSEAMWIIGVSVLIATLVFQKKQWYKGLFDFSQIVVTAFLAGHVFTLIAGGPATMDSFRAPMALVAVVATGVVYFFVNTFLVSGAVALTEGNRVAVVWRREYGYGHDISSSAALFALSPLLVLSYLAVGVGGMVLFFVPILFIRDADKKYRDLQKTYKSLIRAERMAAKGEMAAEIAHELNNYLAAVSGRAQLILMNPQKVAESGKGLDQIVEQVKNMSVLTKGLMDFSHKEVQMQPVDLNGHVERTVEFVRPQNKYDRVEFEMALDPAVGTVQLDPGQIQQVLLNLFSNAADAFRDAGIESGKIRIETRREAKSVVVSVTDNGPGIPEHVVGKIFEPAFTTKVDGHGFGLATCYRIVENHGGHIRVESSEGAGAVFVVTLPAAERGVPGDAAKAA